MAAPLAAIAIYFGRRFIRSAGARRVAAAVLAGVFAGIALDGAVHLLPIAQVAGDAGATVEVARRVPLLLATLVTTALLRLGAGR